MVLALLVWALKIAVVIVIARWFARYLVDE
jgi:hypothetical protein